MRAARVHQYAGRSVATPHRTRLGALLFVLPLALFAHAGRAEPGDLATPAIPARAFVLIETQSGTELAAHDADTHLPPASLTKLMTAYLLFSDLRAGRLRLDDHVTVSARAAHLPGSRMFLRAGETVPAEELFKGMLVESGNDATFALVERVAPDLETFVSRMNMQAQALGLVDTHFANATGLNNPAHYSSARDLARLAAAVRRDFPEYAGWFALHEFSWAGITQPNRNRLLGHVPGVDGLKTGHTQTAGYCLAASAARDGMQLIAVTLGSDSENERARAGRALLEFGFRAFETRLAYRAGAPLATLPVWEGASDAVTLGVEHDTWLTLPRGGFAELGAQPVLPGERRAPVARGERLGQLDVTHDGERVAELPLVALTEVPQGGLARRLADRLRLWLRHGGSAAAAP